MFFFSFSIFTKNATRILMRSSLLVVLFTFPGFSGSLTEYHPQSIKFPPPCLNMGMVFSWLTVLQTFAKQKPHPQQLNFHLIRPQKQPQVLFLCPIERLCASLEEQAHRVWSPLWLVSMETRCVQCCSALRCCHNCSLSSGWLWWWSLDSSWPHTSIPHSVGVLFDFLPRPLRFSYCEDLLVLFKDALPWGHWLYSPAASCEQHLSLCYWP